MRREEISALGIELPLLPTLVRGALPGGAGWAERLVAAGLDVIASGAERDTLATWTAARDVLPSRPCRAIDPVEPEALVAGGCRLIEKAGPGPVGAYVIGLDEAGVTVVTDAPEIEDPNRIARLVVNAARQGDPSRLWVTAGPGLDALPEAVVEAKLRALVESAVQARMVLAKEQFDVWPGGERPESGETRPPGG